MIREPLLGDRPYRQRRPLRAQSPQFARHVADRVAFLDGGVLAALGPPAELLDSPPTDRLRDFLGALDR